ncbi:MAG: MaoC family dehydratase N-terminal domain-containing protein [Aquamicrobium sp.]|uniref:MaoC/PaaZ C-terminal domain-containing protein n=1 Tax=Aquamicrobium sp. TaxID=1872579 RepID=UPI00349EFFB1|nr:MaoC family dehydratase N-terminal domain-containing protein [Aquamicrobium sp.]
MSTLYYEDIETGARWRTAGRTVTEADSTMFSMLSGDWNPIHCNEDYARRSRFGQRIVAGIFGLSLITGAMNQWGIFETSALAMLNIRDWQFRKPILIGTTLIVQMEITGKRLVSSGATGIIERRFDLLDPADEVIQTGFSDMMIARKPQP